MTDRARQKKPKAAPEAKASDRPIATDACSIAYAGPYLAVGGFEAIALYRDGKHASTVDLSTSGGVFALAATTDRLYAHEEKRVFTVAVPKPAAKETLTTVSAETVGMLRLSPNGTMAAVGWSTGAGGGLKVVLRGEKRARLTTNVTRAAWLDDATLVGYTRVGKKIAITTHPLDKPELKHGSLQATAHDIVALAGAAYLGTDQGLARVTLDRTRALDAGADVTWLWKDAPVRGLCVHDGTIVMASDAGVYRVDAKGKATRLAARSATQVAGTTGRLAYIHERLSPERVTLTEVYELPS